MKICTNCHGPVSSRNTTGFCTKNPECIKINRRVNADNWKRKNPQATIQATRNWQEANKARHQENNKRSYRAWKQRNPDKVRQRSLDRKIRKKELSLETVNLERVLEKSKGLCQICFKELDPTNWHLDHILPLACCGFHLYENVQATHPHCNLSKGAKHKCQ